MKNPGSVKDGFPFLGRGFCFYINSLTSTPSASASARAVCSVTFAMSISPLSIFWIRRMLIPESFARACCVSFFSFRTTRNFIFSQSSPPLIPVHRPRPRHTPGIRGGYPPKGKDNCRAADWFVTMGGIYRLPQTRHETH